jgi:hypothetical protein
MDRRWHDAVVDLLARTRMIQPDQMVGAVNAAVAGLGVHIIVFLVDHEQLMLRAVPEPGGTPAGREPQPVDASLAGRAFMTGEPVAGPTGSPLWMPLVDGSDRLGVIRVDADPAVVAGPEFRRQVDLLAALLGHLVVIMAPYGDVLSRTRRVRRMSAGSELLWRLLPPLTYASDRFVVSAVFEPTYDVGGDGFDYSIDGDAAYAAICDTTGKGLRAAQGTAVALSALRAARVHGDGLVDMARAVDDAFAAEFTDSRFSTAVLMRLDLRDGTLRYLNAGHPPPVVLRAGRAVARLDAGRRIPLGLAASRVDIGELRLERGDRVLCFTDGVTEARDPAGEPFGEERLIDLAERNAAAGLPAPETLRRLSLAILSHLNGPPSDDATVLLMEWSRQAAARVIPLV